MTEPKHPTLHNNPTTASSSRLRTKDSRLTPRGTPCARSWSPEWIAHVEAIEDKLDRRICGAKTPTGEPCRMAPANHNGAYSSPFEGGRGDVYSSPFEGRSGAVPRDIPRGDVPFSPFEGGRGDVSASESSHSSGLQTQDSDESLLSSASPVVDARLCEQHHERHSHESSHSSGLRTPDSGLPNGRCNFHGGADLAGGQPGNQNAASHGLYARGLRPCSQSCPLWDKCPLACKAVAELDAPQRPTCPYELHDYQTAVKAFTDMVAPPPQADPDTLYPLEADILTRIVEIFAGPAPSADNDEPSNHVNELDRNEPSIEHDDDDTDSHHDNRMLPPHLRDLVHRTATLSVMVNRAAAAMREADVIDQTNIRSNNYNATYARPHAYVQAYLRLSSEFRRYHAMLKEYAPKPTPPQQRKPLSLSDIITSINDRARERERAANEDQPQSEDPSTATEPPAQSDATDPSDPSDPTEQPQEHHLSPNDETSLSPTSNHSPDLDDYTSNAERFQEAARRAGAMLSANEPSESAPPNPSRPSAPQSPTLPQKEPNPRGQP